MKDEKLDFHENKQEMQTINPYLTKLWQRTNNA